MLLHSDILVLNLLNDFLISLIFRFVIKIIISSKITNDKNTLTTKAVNIANISMYLLTFLSIRLHGVVGIAPAYAYAPIYKNCRRKRQFNFYFKSLPSLYCFIQCSFNTQRIIAIAFITNFTPISTNTLSYN